MEDLIPFGLGALKNKEDNRDYRVAGIVEIGGPTQQDFVLDNQQQPNNQWQRPSCTAQAFSHHKERQEGNESAARFAMALTKRLEGNEGEGAYTRNVFKIGQSYGIPSQSLDPEPLPPMSWKEYINPSHITEEMYKDAEQHKLKSYWALSTNIDDLKREFLALNSKEKNTSVVMSMEWFREFNNASIGSEGVLPTTFYQSAGGHAVEMIGFLDSKEQLVFKNSWGSSWGNKGYFYMPYSIARFVLWDATTSLDYPKELPVDKRYGLPRTWQSYLLERRFAFDPWIRSKIKRFPNNREIIGLAYGKWDFEAVFQGRVGDKWLYYTKPEATNLNLI